MSPNTGMFDGSPDITLYIADESHVAYIHICRPLSHTMTLSSTFILTSTYLRLKLSRHRAIMGLIMTATSHKAALVIALQEI